MNRDEKYPVIYRRTLNPFYWISVGAVELGAIAWRLFFRAPFQGLVDASTKNVMDKDSVGPIKIGFGIGVISVLITIATLLAKR